MSDELTRTVGQFKVTENDYTLLERAANQKRLTVTAYVRQAALQRAEADFIHGGKSQ